MLCALGTRPSTLSRKGSRSWPGSDTELRRHFLFVENTKQLASCCSQTVHCQLCNTSVKNLLLWNQLIFRDITDQRHCSTNCTMKIFSFYFAVIALLSTKASAVPCTHSGTKIKIQSTTGKPLSMREVRVFSGGINVAIGKNATQSSDSNDESGASKAVDGEWRTISTTGDSCSTWWEVDLEESITIDKVLIVNPKCSGDSSCSCELSHATISILDANSTTISSNIVGDTCDKGWVSHKFSFEADEADTCQPASSPSNASVSP